VSIFFPSHILFVVIASCGSNHRSFSIFRYIPSFLSFPAFSLQYSENPAKLRRKTEIGVEQQEKSGGNKETRESAIRVHKTIRMVPLRVIRLADVSN